MSRAGIVMSCALALAACGAPEGGADGGAADARPDLDAPDAPCARDSECGAASFCAPRRCAPGDPAADARGCVEAAAPCAAGQVCDEARGACRDSSFCEDGRDGCLAPGDCDGDGSLAAECGGNDCDDEDGARYPGNAEVCDPDGHDEDCDPETYGFRDADRDGWPDARCCNGERCGDDCDDTLPSAHPSEAESCDGLDNDCDGDVDEGVTLTFYPDVDRDGHGDPAGAPVEACFAPEGYAERADDCDDAVGAVHPGAAERCDANTPPLDEDCDGEANPETLCNCTGSETGPCLEPGVCTAGTRTCVAGMWSQCSIAATAESCDGEDDDCDGQTDEGLLVRCFADGDGDTFPEPGAALAQLCPDPARTFVGTCPIGFTDREPIGAGALDCDDGDAARFPMASETCDAVDQDCDGAIDEGRRVTCWADGDSDGFAASGAMASDLCPPPGMSTCPAGTTGREPLGGQVDCDDASAARSPAVIESCNEVDDDCDGRTDESLRIDCWTDADRDGYPASGATLTPSCPSSGGGCPSGLTANDPAASAVDCDDASAARSPGISESCNAIDDDCDTAIDEGVTVTCYTDGDGDSFAPAGATVSMVCPAAGGACPAGTTNRGPGAMPDCDDSNAGVSPVVAEACNGVDDDCDGAVDEGVLALRYPDADHDGFGDSSASAVLACAGDPDFAGNNADCGDSDARAYPGQATYFTSRYCPSGTTVCPSGAGCDDGTGCRKALLSNDFDCNGVVEPEVESFTCPTGGCGFGCFGSGPTYRGLPCGGEMQEAECVCGSGFPASCTQELTGAPAGVLRCR